MGECREKVRASFIEVCFSFLFVKDGGQVQYLYGYQV